MTNSTRADFTMLKKLHHHTCLWMLSVGLLFLFCCFCSLFASQVDRLPLTRKFDDVRSYKPSDGLAGDVVRSIIHTPDGSVWFACWGRGISRFDGYQWIHYSQNDGLPTLDVRILFTDRDHRIWAGTTEGIALWDSNKWQLIDTHIAGFNHPSVFQITQVANGALWFGISQGQILQWIANNQEADSIQNPQAFIGKTGEWSIILSSQQTQTNNVECILPVKNGEVWVAVNNLGILTYSNSVWQMKWSGVEEQKVGFSLLQMTDESIWGAGGSSLIRYTQNHRQVIPLDIKLPYCLGRANEKELFVGTSKGLGRYTGDQWLNIDLDENANNSRIYTIAHGNSNEVWVGSQAGAFRLTDKAWISANPSLDSRMITNVFFHTDQKQTPIAVNGNGALFEWKENSWRWSTNLSSLNDVCSGISISQPGKLWALFSDRLVEFDLNHKAALRSLPIPEIQGIRSVYCSPTGRLFMFGQRIIYEYENNRWQTIRAKADDSVNSLFEDSVGRLWAIWANIGEWETNKTWRSITELGKGQFGKELESIAVSKDGSTLLGLAIHGIYILKKEQGQQLATFEGRPNKQSSTLLESSDGTLWTGHRQNGISSYRDGLWISYSQKHGIPSGRVSFIGEDPQGNLWAVVQMGEIIRYAPNRDGPRVELIAPHTSVDHGDRAVFYFKSADKWNQTPPEAIYYSWRITPANAAKTESHWSSFKTERIAVLPKLPPGSYRFEVRALDGDRNLSESSAEVDFEVAGPIWQKPIFYWPISVLSLMVILLMVMWLRKHQLLKNTLENLEHLVEKRTVEVNCINISLRAEVEERKRAVTSLQQQLDFDDLLTQLLTRFASSSGPEIDDSIQGSLQQLGVYFEVDFAVIIHISPDRSNYSIVYEWDAPGVPRFWSKYQKVPFGNNPWTEGKILSGQSVKINSTRDFPTEAEPTRQRWEQQGFKSGLIVPMQGQGVMIKGMLGLFSLSREIEWSEENVHRLEMACHAIANLLERQHTEEQVQKQAALLDISQDGIAVMDMEGRVQYWNHGAEKMVGWTAREVLGRPLNPEIYKECQETLAIAQEQLRRVGFWKGELVLYSKADRKLLVQSSRTLVRDKEGKPQAIFVVNSDITDQKQIENQLMRMQRVESVGRLANGIAHDFNNILTPIMMSVELLRERENHVEDLEFIELMHTSAKRGSDLVKQLLLFGRGSDGNIVELDLSKLAHEIARIIQETFSKSIQFNMQLPPHLEKIIGDSTQIHQVLLNLCVNARDAMPNGGVLNLEIARVDLDKNAPQSNPEVKPGPYVVIIVSDTGTGIAPEIQDKIFDPFFTTKEIGKGTGLGLSTVMGIVKKHDGFIELHSQLGQGSQFKIYLPVISMDQTQNPISTAAPAQRGHGELILIVDDEESICQVARKALLANGYQVIMARDGKEAVTLFAQHQSEIKAVLIDMEMPKMNGIAAIHELAKLNPLVRIIATSGLPHMADRIKEAGPAVKCFLPKPWHANQMLKLISQVLQSTEDI